MYDRLGYLIGDFLEEFNWFGASDNQVVMGSLEFIVLLLGNNVFMVLMTFFLASRWGAETERKKDQFFKTKIEREHYAGKFNRRIL